ncbi:MAG: hypothetical protein Tsb0016_09800 [Sphingomonadales bacterium]
MALAGASGGLAAHAAGLDDPDILFALDRKGQQIGTHGLRFSRLDDGRLRVDIAIDIKVKVAFITLFRYEHRAMEVWDWQGRRLDYFWSETDDNGRAFRVEGARDAEGFAWRNQDGQTWRRDDALMTTYWHPKTLRHRPWINSQKGPPLEIAMAPGEDAAITAPTGEIWRGQRHAVTGGVRVNLIYDPGGCLIGLDFTPPKNDVPIVYRMLGYFDPSDARRLAGQPQLAPCLERAGDMAGNTDDMTGEQP